jgi:hypothetical protein
VRHGVIDPQERIRPRCQKKIPKEWKAELTDLHVDGVIVVDVNSLKNGL